MNQLKLLLSSFSLSLCGLLVLLSASAQTPPCKSGNLKNDAYMLRDNQKRCEGITTLPISKGDFDLRSLTVGRFQPTSVLSLTLPKVPNLAKPSVRVQSSNRFYQLDPLDLKSVGNQWQFQWSNDVIRSANITYNSLRSLAQADNAVLPVLLSKSSVYDIRIYTGGRSKTITLSILKPNSTELYRKILSNQPGEEVAFSWDGKDKTNKFVPPGQYTLKVEAQIEQRDAPPEPRSRTRQFFHDPAWLK